MIRTVGGTCYPGVTPALRHGTPVGPRPGRAGRADHGRPAGGADVSGRAQVDVLQLGVVVQGVRTQLAPDAGLLEPSERVLTRTEVLELTDTVPVSIARATRSARPASRVHTEPDNP